MRILIIFALTMVSLSVNAQLPQQTYCYQSGQSFNCQTYDQNSHVSQTSYGYTDDYGNTNIQTYTNDIN